MLEKAELKPRFKIDKKKYQYQCDLIGNPLGQNDFLLGATCALFGTHNKTLGYKVRHDGCNIDDARRLRL